MSGMAGRVVLGASLAWLAANASAQTSFTLKSPDSRIEVRVRAADRIEYDVLVGDRVVLERSTLSMTVGEQTLGVEPAVAGCNSPTTSTPAAAGTRWDSPLSETVAP